VEPMVDRMLFQFGHVSGHIDDSHTDKATGGR
jgi:hypothetical protein